MPQAATASALAPKASTQAPLSAQNLLRAGVPASEVRWFHSLKPMRQMTELRSWRGNLLLEQVRAASSDSAMASMAAAG